MTRQFMLAFVILSLTGCAQGSLKEASQRSHDPENLLNKTWQWESTLTPVEKISVKEPGRYTIQFADEGKLRVKFDCNAGGGNYTLSEGRVSFSPLLSTRMACPEDTQDALFMRDLQRASSFFLQDGKLYLELPNDSGTMRFGQGADR